MRKPPFLLGLLLVVSVAASACSSGTTSTNASTASEIGETITIDSEAATAISTEITADGILLVDVSQKNNGSVDIGALDTSWSLESEDGKHFPVVITTDPSTFTSKTLRPGENQTGKVAFNIKGEKGLFYLTFKALKIPGQPKPQPVSWKISL